MPGKQDRFRKSRPCANPTCGHSKRAHAKWDIIFGWFIGLGPCHECDCQAYVIVPVSGP